MFRPNIGRPPLRGNLGLRLPQMPYPSELLRPLDEFHGDSLGDLKCALDEGEADNRVPEQRLCELEKQE